MSSLTPEILHDAADVVVLDKPSGLSVLADRSGAPCLWDMLPDLLGGKPYQVHRIDKGTSGVLLVARSQTRQRELTQAFQQRRVRKYYLAWVVGAPAPRGLIDLPLKRGRKSRFRVAGQRADIRQDRRGWSLPMPSGDGHSSQTRLRTLRRESGRSLVLLQPLTGRTHQLRVHASWIGHPLLGDMLYGSPASPDQQAPRLQLHCHRLVLPGVGSFVARLPGWERDQSLFASERPSA